MSDEPGKEMSLRYIPFKGKKEEWDMWSQKFLAKARKKGYKELLTGKLKMKEQDDVDYEEEEEKRIEKLNEEAYYDLSSAMEN